MNPRPPIPPSGMTDDSLRNYLIEEFVEDYQEGKITRRDALKKLGAIFGSMLIATNFLAACAPELTATPVPPKPTTAPTFAASSSSTSSTSAAIATASSSSSVATSDVNVSPDDPAIEARMVDFKSSADNITAYLAKPKGNGPFPIVLICHENRGLTDHIKDVARRSAKAGFASLAIDLLSREGGTDKVGANVPGKPRVFMPYIGFPDYTAKLEDVRTEHFAGFELQR